MESLISQAAFEAVAGKAPMLYHVTNTRTGAAWFLSLEGAKSAALAAIAEGAPASGIIRVYRDGRLAVSQGYFREAA